MTIRVECLIGQKLPQVPVTGARGSFVAFGVTGGAHIQAGGSHEVWSWLTLGPLWEDHRDALEDPLGTGEGCKSRGKVNEK